MVENQVRVKNVSSWYITPTMGLICIIIKKVFHLEKQNILDSF